MADVEQTEETAAQGADGGGDRSARATRAG